MIKTIFQPINIRLALTLFAFLAVFAIFAGAAYAQDPAPLPSSQSLADQAQQGVDAAGGQQNSSDLGDVIVAVVNFLLFAIGILSVIMVIVGGIRYVVSAGDSNATQSARNTILYAIIGLVVAFTAWGLVNFVTNILINSGDEEQSSAPSQSLINKA